MLKENLVKGLSVALLLFFVLPAVAQVGISPQQQQQSNEVTDEQLKTFAAITGELEQMQASSREDMEKILEDHGMTVDRFNEIMQAMQTGAEIELSDEERERFELINEKIQEYQQGNQQKAIAVLEKHGMDQQLYMQIQQQLQTDPRLQERYEELK